MTSTFLFSSNSFWWPQTLCEVELHFLIGRFMVLHELRHLLLLKLLLIFCTSEGCIMVSEFHNFLPPVGLKIFYRLTRPSGLRNDQWQQGSWVCESTSVSVLCNKNKYGTTSIPKYVPICTKFGTHVHWYGR